MSNILYKSKNAIIAYKPPGIPTQPDKSGDRDIMRMLSEELWAIGEPQELYLIHRLDRVVGGLLVFARNKESAAKLSAIIASDGISKEYFAVVEGRADGGEMRDYLRKDSILGKATVANKSATGAKEALLTYTVLDRSTVENRECSLIKIHLKTGRFHQIRAQFSSRNMPLVGDNKYGSKIRKARMPALFAFKVDTYLDSEHLCAFKSPDISAFPWNLFAEDKYCDK